MRPFAPAESIAVCAAMSVLLNSMSKTPLSNAGNNSPNIIVLFEGSRKSLKNWGVGSHGVHIFWMRKLDNLS